MMIQKGDWIKPNSNNGMHFNNRLFSLTCLPTEFFYILKRYVEMITVLLKASNHSNMNLSVICSTCMTLTFFFNTFVQ